MSKKVFLAISLLVLLVSSPAFPFITGLTVESPYGTPKYVYFFRESAEVDLGDIWWDPQLPPIWKIFETDGTGGNIYLNESFHVSGTVPFTDWDEQLFVQDATGKWVYSPESDGLIWLDGQANPLGTVNIDQPIDLITIKWDPALPPCTDVSIQKTIFVPAGMTKFAVVEWPTVPEPSMILLSGIAVLGLLVYKKR